MVKKIYKQPSMKVIDINSNDIICGSPDTPTRMSLFDKEVDDNQKPESVSSDIWGTQW